MIFRSATNSPRYSWASCFELSCSLSLCNCLVDDSTPLQIMYVSNTKNPKLTKDKIMYISHAKKPACYPVKKATMLFPTLNTSWLISIEVYEKDRIRRKFMLSSFSRMWGKRERVFVLFCCNTILINKILLKKYFPTNNLKNYKIISEDHIAERHNSNDIFKDDIIRLKRERIT